MDDKCEGIFGGAVVGLMLVIILMMYRILDQMQNM